MKRHPIVSVTARASAITLMFMVAGGQAEALPQDADQNIDFEAQHAELDQNAGTIVYTGNVKAVQGTMQVLADELTVQFEDGKVVRITARGNPARYSQQLEADKGKVKADASTIVYHTSDERVDLQGQASLEQGGNLVVGDLIHYDIVAGRVTAQAGDEGPVKGTFQPRSQPE